MNCPRCGNDQWGRSRDSFGREDIVCVNCGLLGLLGQPAIDALVDDWVTNHEPPEATIQAGSAFHLAE
jgi:transcription initiation factor TFIIIB Brf1 subunit/transcription initiation factor TFIIB